MTGLDRKTLVGIGLAVVALIGVVVLLLAPGDDPQAGREAATEAAPVTDEAQTVQAGEEAAENAAPAEGAQIARAGFEAGAQLYAENCASCHGEKLEGEPDWRIPREDGTVPAPPHDESGHTWHHGDPTLFNYVKKGGEQALAEQGIEFNSGMPGFGDSLTDDEIRDILAYIRSTWSDRVQKLQAARTEAELAAR